MFKLVVVGNYDEALLAPQTGFGVLAEVVHHSVTAVCAEDLLLELVVVLHEGHPVTYLDVREPSQRPDRRTELLVAFLASLDDGRDFDFLDIGGGLTAYHDDVVFYG